jgi:glyoxylase-like metal-dependent hydrolase (beta-lactamase superfamily II)
MQTPLVKHFFDEATNTFSYVVMDPESNACTILDSVLDFDYAAGRTDVRSADGIIDYVEANDLSVEWILETHVHADHLSAAPYLHEKLGGFARDGSQFDRLFEEGMTEVDFVKLRTERDATLDMPGLILPSVQVNMRAGNMPPADDNGQVYLKIPINRF